ncbi:5242_t:CDS:2, partial [Ambispora gerdemannii]
AMITDIQGTAIDAKAIAGNVQANANGIYGQSSQILVIASLAIAIVAPSTM